MENYTLAECQTLFDTLLPKGFADPQILIELAPEGWENSPYCSQDHTPVEVAYQHKKELHASTKDMFKGIPEGFLDMDMGLGLNLESFEEFKQTYTGDTVHPTAELRELMGCCLWDIFSDNNEVIKSRKCYDLGSSRGTAGFIADRLNQESEKKYEYMNFYMGSFDTESDLTPVYELIFRRLKNVGCDWIFHFTQLGIVDFSGLKQEDDTPLEAYNPNRAMEKELEKQQKQKEKDDFREKLATFNAQEREDALYKPPPKVVQAYKNVFGKFPIGWPPA